MVQFVSGTQRDLFAETQRLLQVLAQLPAVREGSAAACSALLTRLHKQGPRPALLFLFRRQAEQRCVLQAQCPSRTASTPVTGRTTAARNALHARLRHRRLPDRSDHRARHHRARPTRARRRGRGAGHRRRRASISAGSTGLPPRRSCRWARRFTLVDHAGNVLARDPDGEKWIGRSLAGTPLLAAMHAQHEGVFETAGFDDVPRLYAFIAIYESYQEGHVHVSVGIPAGHGLCRGRPHPSRATWSRSRSWCSLMLGVAWAGGDVFVLRKIRALVSAARRLG